MPTIIEQLSATDIAKIKESFAEMLELLATEAMTKADCTLRTSIINGTIAGHTFTFTIELSARQINL